MWLQLQLDVVATIAMNVSRVMQYRSYGHAPKVAVEAGVAVDYYYGNNNNNINNNFYHYYLHDVTYLPKAPAVHLAPIGSRGHFFIY